MRSRKSLILLSAFLLISSFPNLNIWSFAWIALVPLFFALEGKAGYRAFITSYITGSLFFLGTIYWLIHVTFPGMLVVVFYLSLYFGIFGLIVAYLQHEKNILRLVMVPAAWVACEWLRSNLLGGFGWALISHSQAVKPLMIQISDITGAYGVSFVIVFVNFAIYLTIKDMMARQKNTYYLAAAIALIFLTSAYGTLRIKNIFTGEHLKVAVIQGNIPQAKKWDRNFREEILDKYGRLTREASQQRPELVIWPETSVPAFIELEKDVSDRMSGIAKAVNAAVLVGSPSAQTGNPDILYNSAVLFGPDGGFTARYDKIHLVPFGEYVPFKRFLSFVERFAPSPIGDFTHGKDFTVFKIFIERKAVQEQMTWRLSKRVRFSVLICFEDIFPELARSFVKRGAGFLVNITNDAWFKDTSAPYQHAQASVFRAVENRVNVVRAANTGISCFIDQKGRIVSSVKDRSGETFVEGFRVHDIVLTPTRTFYTVYGDIFAFVCIGALAVFLLQACLIKFKR